MATGRANSAPEFTVSAEVFVQEIEDESVLLDLRSGYYYGLNAVGTRIWSLLASGAGFEQIVDTIEAEFDAPRDLIRDDARTLIADLRAKGLLT